MKLRKVLSDFQKDKLDGGNYWETFQRKIVHSFITHKYELGILKPYWRQGYALNVGAGRDCGKLGKNVVSMDFRDGEDDYTKLAGWDAITPDIVKSADDPFPFKSETFDCVFSMHVIEHLKDPVFSINEMIRITKIGGFICGVIPCGAKNKPYNYWKDPTHLHIWTKHDFKQFLSQFFDQCNLIQYNKMNNWLNGWSVDFVMRRK